MYKSLGDAIRDAESTGQSLAQIALARESEDQGRSVEEIRESLARALAVVGDLHPRYVGHGQCRDLAHHLMVTKARRSVIVTWSMSISSPSRVGGFSCTPSLLVGPGERTARALASAPQ